MKLKYWIKERHNPQLGIYYVGCGQMTKSAARKMEKPIYGDNVLLPFDTEQEYLDTLAELRKSGKSVQQPGTIVKISA